MENGKIVSGSHHSVRAGSGATRGRGGLLRGAFAVGLAFVALSGCLFDQGSGGDVPVDGDYVPAKPVAPRGWPAIVWPADNAYSPEKDILGRRLFYDRRLSRTGNRACAWCHAPQSAFTDPRHMDFSSGSGTGITGRNSPTAANMAFATTFFFDGRAASLEEQALGPLYAHNEMDMTGPEILALIRSDTAYVRLFRQAFGKDTVSMSQVAKALATFERTLISHRSPYDRWREGDTAALSDSARRGEALFSSPRLACASCHVPPLFTDGNFHNVGLDSVVTDSGRSRVTGLPQDVGRFKTPTLRNIAVSDPYMHDGRFYGLPEVLAHYNRGGFAHPNKDPRVRPLALTTRELADLTAFLHALTDDAFLELPPYMSPN
jgi:cytochrome c peroxidase